MKGMTSSRPYLIRAIHEWILDNGMTPHILVDVQGDEVVVPQEHVDEGRIVLNIAPAAVHGLVIGNERIAFSARFGGRPMAISVPSGNVLAIYARENGQGMLFSGDEGSAPAPEPEDTPLRKRPTLKVVK